MTPVPRKSCFWGPQEHGARAPDPSITTTAALTCDEIRPAVANANLQDRDGNLGALPGIYALLYRSPSMRLAKSTDIDISFFRGAFTLSISAGCRSAADSLWSDSLQSMLPAASLAHAQWRFQMNEIAFDLAKGQCCDDCDCEACCGDGSGCCGGGGCC